MITLKKSLIKSLGIKDKVMLYITLVTIIVYILLSGYIYIYSANDIKNNYIENIKGELNKSAEIINKELNAYIDKSNYIITNAYLINNMNEDYSSDVFELMQFHKNLDYFFSGLSIVNKGYLIGFTIYTENKSLMNGKYIQQMDSFQDTDLYNQIVDAPVNKMFWKINTLNKYNNQKQLSLYRLIGDLTKKRGIIEMNMSLSNLEYYIKDGIVSEKGIIQYKDEKGEVILSSSPVDNNSKVKKTYISNKLINGHELVAIVPENNLQDRYHSILFWISLIFVVVFVFSWAISNYFLKRITSGLTSFINTIKSEDKLIVPIEVEAIGLNDEMSVIKHKFRELLLNISDAYEEAAKSKAEKSAIEMELLQSKINPHLLYNSLSVIKWKALRNNDINTSEMIDTITKYYRTALNKGNSIIQIKDELEMIMQYMKINEFSYLNTYQLHINVDDNIMNYYIIKLLLQPIVENAILHGLNGMGSKGEIIINGRQDGDYIVFEISDNGHGMEKEKIDHLIGLKYDAEIGGYGIRNTINRIKLYYGDECGISIKSEVGIGTSVTVIIKCYSHQELVCKTNF